MVRCSRRARRAQALALTLTLALALALTLALTLTHVGPIALRDPAVPLEVQLGELLLVRASRPRLSLGEELWSLRVAFSSEL